METFWRFAKEVAEVVAYLAACLCFFAGEVDKAVFWVLVAIYLSLRK